MAGTINASSFVSVGSGYALAASSSYLYACYDDVGIGKLARSANGVDWADDPAGLSSLKTLLNGSTHIVLTGSVATYVLDKTGSTWVAVDAGDIGEATSGGRYVNGTFFVFGATNYYYTADNGVTWTAGNPARVLVDVGYDGTDYLLATVDRVYATNDFSSYTPYPLPFSALSIAYLDGLYWLSGYSALSSARIYSSSDLLTFTQRFVDTTGYDCLSVVDGRLFMSNYANAASNGDIFVLDYNSITSRTALTGITDVYDHSSRLGLCFKHTILVNNGYVYVAGGDGALYRASYDASWTAAPYTGEISGTLRLDSEAGAFAARAVYLYNYSTGALVAATTSNETTGEWSFTTLPAGDYFVVGAATVDDYTTYSRDFDALGVITVV